MPKLEATSRLTVTLSIGPAFAWSLATSVMPGMLLHLVEEERRPMGKLGRIGVGQGVLILRLGQARADGDVLCGLHVERDALDPGELRPQPVDDLVGAGVALACAGFRAMNTRPWLSVAVGPPGPICSRPRDRGILQQDIDQRLLALGHRRERDILCGLGDADDLAGVLLREEALGNDDVEVAGQRNRAQHHHQRDEAVAQHDLQAALVEARRPSNPRSSSR